MPVIIFLKNHFQVVKTQIAQTKRPLKQTFFAFQEFSEGFSPIFNFAFAKLDGSAVEIGSFNFFQKVKS